MLAQVKKGDCEVCSKPEGVETNLTLMHGNIWMCDTCKSEDEAASIASGTRDAKNLITYSRKVDAVVEIKADVFVAEAVSFVALQAAIEANAEIPADRKNYAILTEVDARIKVLNAAIFEQKAALVQKENERNALLHNAQQVAARLREVDRAKFKQFDITYQPAPVRKPVKAGKAGKSKVTFKLSELKSAAAKYGIPLSVIQFAVVQKNITPDEAAKQAAQAAGLLD